MSDLDDSVSSEQIKENLFEFWSIAEENELLHLIAPSYKNMKKLHKYQMPQLINLAIQKKETLDSLIEILFRYNKMWFDIDSLDLQQEMEDQLDDGERIIEVKKDKHLYCEVPIFLT